MYAGRSDGGSDGGMAGALLDDTFPAGTFPDDGVRRMPDSTVPGDLPPDLEPGLQPDFEPGTGPDAGPDWPPSVVPVVLWPEDVLREALGGVPGVWLARVVAEAVDVDGNLDRGVPAGRDPDVDAGTGAGVLGGLSDDVLGDLVTACGRLQSWAAGVQARVVAERAARECHPLAHVSLVGQVTSELVVTEPEAVEVVVRGECGAQHPTVIAALIAGRIDTRKAHTLLRSAARLTVAERAEAISRFLPQAPGRTWKWLQTRMLAFAKDHHGAAESATAEAQRRSVQLDRAENDMGWLSAYLPATDAAAVWGVVDDMAHQLRHATGEDRTLAQLRADSLTGIITGRLLPADRYTDTDTDTTVGTTTDTSTGTGGDSDVGTDGDGDGRDTVSGASSGTHDDAGSSAEGTGAAGVVQEAADDTESGTARSTDVDVPVCTCGGRAPVQQVVVQEVVQEIVRPVRITPTRPVVRVTIPASALLGLNDAPGDLDGYGPIPADTARSIAQDATWQRLLTDPVTGILTDYSTTTYQPGKVLRAAVEARDGTCTFLWGCDTPASRCDLDHIQPFDHDTDTDPAAQPPGTPGQTRAQNLHPLCRKHHLLKTHTGWAVVRDPDTGITTWTTPTGRTHTRPPTVLDTHIALDQIDPDTSHDLTLQALTSQHLPRPYTTTEPRTAPTGTAPTGPASPPFPDRPPF